MDQSCCHIGCDKQAVNMITGRMGIGYDDTYMCEDHTGEYKSDEYTVTPLR